MNYKSELVGVFGYPVEENPTIVMQEAAFQALNLNWRYLNIEVKPGELAQAFTGLRAFGMQGINLTIPHKVDVLPLLDRIAESAQLIGAVNTVWRDGDALVGENTDGKGFLRGIREDAGFDPAGKRFIIMGAGGAARAITVELALAGAAHLLVVNRSVERGQALVDHLNANTPVEAEFQAWTATVAVTPETDCLVNATSIGLYPDVEAMPDVDLSAAGNDLLVCDVVPNPPNTRLMQQAEAQGLKTLNGLAMLVYQGAIGFKLWTGHDAPEDVMKSALQKAFET